MAEEKILEEEVLSEEELENVAGGYENETIGDYENFQKLGGIFSDRIVKKYDRHDISRAFRIVGDMIGADIKVQVFDYSGNVHAHNRYYLNGAQISRDEMWSIINEGYAANKK